MRVNLTPPFCLCGCGQQLPSPSRYAHKDRSFLRGHAARVNPPKRRFTPIGDRFLQSFVIKTECWEWTKTRNASNYGVIPREPPNATRLLLAHRYSWELHYGPIPDGMEVCHHCDNPPCVRPDHLFLGTHQDNLIDMNQKGRHPKAGAKLTPEDIPGIRARIQLGELHRVIGDTYGVNRQAIDDIAKGNTWRDVP